MWRYLSGVGSALLLVTAGLFVWRAQAGGPVALPAMPAAAVTDAGPLSFADLAGAPAASAQTREGKRFARYDKDRNGAVARAEYLAGREKGFARLDLDHDGRLSLDEYAQKAVVKFTAADRDRNGALNTSEFATTRVVRKARPRVKCAPSLRAPVEAEAAEEG
jgi:hypothetical protein